MDRNVHRSLQLHQRLGLVPPLLPSRPCALSRQPFFKETGDWMPKGGRSSALGNAFGTILQSKYGYAHPNGKKSMQQHTTWLCNLLWAFMAKQRSVTFKANGNLSSPNFLNINNNIGDQLRHPFGKACLATWPFEVKRPHRASLTPGGAMKGIEQWIRLAQTMTHWHPLAMPTETVAQGTAFPKQ